MTSLKYNCIVSDMDRADSNCPELTEKTAAAIDIGSLHQLFTSTQMNNFNLCIKQALRDIVPKLEAGSISWNYVMVIASMSFPHFWNNNVSNLLYLKIAHFFHRR